MNPVENPMMQLMQAFGASSPQSVAAMFGTQDAAGEVQENYSALFSNYLNASDRVASSRATAAFSHAVQNRIQAIHAAPADSTYAIDPSAALAPIQVALQSPEAGSDALSRLFADLSANGDQISSEMLDAFSLAVNYQAATPLELTPANLEALQAALPSEFTDFHLDPGTGSLTLPHYATATTSADQASPGHLLPVSDLKFLLGDTTQLPPGLAGDAPGLLIGATPAATQQVPGESALKSPVPAASTQNTATAPGVLAANNVVADPQAAAAHTQGSGLDAATHASAAQNSASNGAQNAAAMAATGQRTDAETDPDGEGQILAVTQKQKANNTKSGATTTQSYTASPAKTSEIAQSQAGAAANQASTQALGANTGKRGQPAPKSDTQSGKTAPTAAATSRSTDMAPATAARGTVDWTSPWTTPERAAGWPDSFSAGLISSGLGGLTGQSSALNSMGLMGGRPDAALGGQIAKQLNVNITRAVKAGDSQFSMRMDPPELGRITVKLTFGQNGLVKSQVIAERPETLDLLQREVRGLERAVEAGGHRSEPGGISFSLDSGGHESAGRAFAEAMQQDRLKDDIENGAGGQSADDTHEDGLSEQEVDLDEILAHVTPETGLDVRV